MTYLSGEIKAALAAGKKVVWLTAGGSSVAIAVEVANEIRENPHLANLTVSLTDERYGRPGHKDSNWQQLEDKGFALDGAKLLPVLSGDSLEVTAQKYADTVSRAIENADYSVALAGLGPDGHILGIKPVSPAVNTKDLAVGYKWDDYERVTLTFEILKRLDEVIVYAIGREKWPQFDMLAKEVSTEKQPAQLLKKLKKVTIFNDYKEAI